MQALPGAEAVGLTTAWPLQQARAQIIETRGSSNRETTGASVHAVSEDYFSTLGIRRAEGRGFTTVDRSGAGPVAIVSESLARRLWPSGALGKRVAVPENQERGEPILVEREIVGVVRDVRQHPADADPADVYVPILQTAR